MKPKKMLVNLTIGSALALSLQAPAAFAGREGNGGHGLALEFTQAAQAAIQNIHLTGSDFPELKSVDLNAILKEAQILVSQSPVYAVKGEVRQESTAINYQNPNTVVINQSLWDATTNDTIRQALALHELLGLAGVEGTGNYTVSERYLDERGIHCNQDLCSAPPKPAPSGFSFDAAEKAFEAGEAPKSLSGTWLVIGVAQTPQAAPSDLFGDGGFGFYQEDGKPPKAGNGNQIDSTKYEFGQSSDVFGNTSSSVTVHNIDPDSGKNVSDQGPFEISYQSTGACFAQHAYHGAVMDTSDVYFSFECRLVNNQTRLLCASTLNGNPASLDDSQRPYIGQIVNYNLFRPISR